MSEARVPEWLIVLDEQSSQTAVAGLREVGEVLHVVPPRLVVVTAPDAAALRALPGVVAVFDSVPESLLDSLGPEETIAAQAFQRRKANREPRPGEGLTWDAPGYEAPDYPPHR
jgi:hypothetical protein